MKIEIKIMKEKEDDFFYYGGNTFPHSPLG